MFGSTSSQDLLLKDMDYNSHLDNTCVADSQVKLEFLVRELGSMSSLTFQLPVLERSQKVAGTVLVVFAPVS